MEVGVFGPSAKTGKGEKSIVSQKTRRFTDINNNYHYRR
jgi:hypothetical protein